MRLAGRIIDCAVLIAVGILACAQRASREASGKRRVLGCDIATPEAEIHWRRFLESLMRRGLKGIKLIIADDHAGLKAARRAVLPAVPWQRCQFHLQQNAGQFVTRQEAKKSVASQMRAIFNAPDRIEAERLLKAALDVWRKAHPKLAQLAEEYQAWRRARLSQDRWVYLWADGIYSGLQAEDERLCALVVIGVNKRGKKYFLAIKDGVRESKQSWREVLLDRKKRGLTIPPKLAVGDGALGFWSTLQEIYPETRSQRCWVKWPMC